ncbi:Mitochondrial potassium channel [Manis javanica]|nr:Mitochondrial potassium channel [Manis javanica]
MRLCLSLGPLIGSEVRSAEGRASGLGDTQICRCQGTALCLTCSSSQPREKGAQEVALGLYHRLIALGQALGRGIRQQASSTAKTWWDRYEEFVGLSEVREAQGKVTEAERAFMVARGLVREARETWEGQQDKLKEVRDRLDRISREDSQYLELATQEHRLLQEDKRLRVAHLHAEDSERESFSLLSAAVRESHEKERARAERTKNWSLVGSVLGALIGVAGSTYVNRVRLQELKAVLLEAQKGPASLQQALRDQASSYSLQQKDLHDLMVDLRGLVQAGSEQSSGTRAEGLREQLHGLEKTFSQTARTIQLAEASARPGLGQPADSALPGPLLESGSLTLALSDMEQRLEAQVHRSALCSTLVTGVAFVATLPVLYLLFRTS